MTYFLDDAPEQAVKIGPSQDEVPEQPGFLQGFGASFDAAAIERNSFLLQQRTVRRVASERAQSALDRMDQDEVAKALQERNVIGYWLDPKVAVNGDPRAAAVVIQMARQQAQAAPDAWADLDLSDESMVSEAQASLQERYQSEMEVASRTGGVTNFLGSTAAMMADPRNLSFMLLTAGRGSFLSVMGREAMINVLAEGVTLPSQFEMADVLDIPDPSVSEALATAAIGGAAFGALGEGLARGIAYYRGRYQNVPVIPGFTPDESREILQALEDSLVSETPFTDAEAIATAVSERTPQPPEGRSPLIPPPVETRSLGQAADAGMIAEISKALDEDSLSLERLQKSNPLIAYLRRGHLQRSGRGNIVTGSSYQIHPDSELAYILRQDGTAQKNVGLISKSGRMDFDNLGASEWESRFPGISDAAGVDGDYLNADGFKQVVRRSADGDLSWMREVQDLEVRVRENSRALRDAEIGTAWDDYTAGDEVSGLIDPRGDVEAQVREFIAGSEYADILTESEIAEIVATAKSYGGDVEYLAERALERGADYHVSRQEPDNGESIPFDENDPRGAAARESGVPTDPFGGAGLVEAVPGGPAGRGPAQAARASDPAQAAIPGTDRVDTGQAQRDRAEVAARQMQSKIRRLDQQRVEDDATSLFATPTRDLFDDPTSKAAREYQDQMAADLRDTIEKEGDFMVDMGDGKGQRSVSSVLDDLDAGDEFADVLALCGRPRGEA